MFFNKAQIFLKSAFPKAICFKTICFTKGRLNGCFGLTRLVSLLAIVLLISKLSIASDLTIKPVSNGFSAVKINDDISLDIYQPELSSPDEKLITLYVMDGQHYFYNAIGYQKALRPGAMVFTVSPKYLVVSINTTKISENSTRGIELTSQAKGFADLLANTIVPFVDKNYPTANEKFYFGWQFAAMFGIKVFNEYPSLFDGYLLASGPYYGEQQLKNTEQVLKANKDLNTKFYLSLGKQEKHAIPGHESLTALFEKYPESGVNWKYNYFDRFSMRYDHFTSPLDALTHGLEWYFDGYSELLFYSMADFEDFGGIAAVKGYYKERAERFSISGEVAGPTQFSLFRYAVEEDNIDKFNQLEQAFGTYQVTGWHNFFAKFFIKHGMTERAEKTYLAALETRADDHRYWAALAKLYKKTGKPQQAINAYQSAIKINTISEAILEEYRQEIELLSERN